MTHSWFISSVQNLMFLRDAVEVIVFAVIPTLHRETRSCVELWPYLICSDWRRIMVNHEKNSAQQKYVCISLNNSCIWRICPYITNWTIIQSVIPRHGRTFFILSQSPSAALTVSICLLLGLYKGTVSALVKSSGNLHQFREFHNALQSMLSSIYI